jgi:hypothetical protein
VDYLGHPINAYHLIRHSALGWKLFNTDILPKLEVTLPHLGIIQHHSSYNNK